MRLSEISKRDSYINSGYNELSDTTETDELREILKKYDVELAIKQYINTNVIYRGMRVHRDSTNSIIYADSTKAARTAANAANGVNAFVSDDPSWAAYPKRNQSFICSMRQIHGYGRSHVVLPIGNPSIGVVPSDDFWEGFKRVLGKVRNLSGYRPDVSDISSFLDHLAEMRMMKDIDTYSDLQQLDKMFKAYIAKAENNDDWLMSRIFNGVDVFTTSSGDKTILGWMRETFDPKNNGFRIMPFSNYETNGQTSEIWFSGEAIFVDDNLFRKTFKFGDMK
jgi:hypothetical protein